MFNISGFDPDEEFDHIIPGGKLIHIINIEDLVSNERSMSDFIYEYLCINKNDIFGDESDRFYDLDPIKMIKIRNLIVSGVINRSCQMIVREQLGKAEKI